MGKILISLDVGNTLGWAEWEDKELIKSNSIVFNNHKIFMGEIRDVLDYKIMSNYIRSAYSFIYEDGVIGDPKKMGGSIKVIKKCGAIESVLEEFGCKYNAIKPRGSGSTKIRKQKNKELVLSLFGAEHCKNQHQIDAVLLGYNYLNNKDTRKGEEK
jgi:ribosomal protein L20A (L18A)